MVKVLVLYVFHKFNDSVDHFFKHCIFRDENIDFLIIANDINFKFNLVNLPEYVMTMVRKNIGRDFGGWSEGLLKDQLYKKYDKFIFANSTITRLEIKSGPAPRIPTLTEFSIYDGQESQ